jgi:hypothetical protein
MMKGINVLIAIGFAAICGAVNAEGVEKRDVCINSAENRQCWDGTHDINTDYYLNTPDTGRVVEVSQRLSF